MTEHTWSAPERDIAAGRTVTNPFDSVPVARRYASGRLYYHRAAVELAAGRLGIGRARLALDLGCGTGLSTRAVRERADQVVAVDTSVAMLGAAEALADVCYVAAGAEQLPLRDASVDFATVGAAFHWFDQSQALAELGRVLRPGAALAVYSDFFHGRVVDGPAVADWFKNSYLPRFPTPPRHAYFDPVAAEAVGFATPIYAEDEISVPLTCTQLADYLLSQSNAALAVEAGRISADALRDDITHELGRVLPPAGHATAVVFGIRLWTTVLRP